MPKFDNSTFQVKPEIHITVGLFIRFLSHMRVGSEADAAEGVNVVGKYRENGLQAKPKKFRNTLWEKNICVSTYKCYIALNRKS